MTKRIEWRGSFYPRVRSNDFRNRNTGDILKRVTIQKRKGMRNKAIYFDGKNFVGIEKTKHHFSGFDPKQSPSAKRRFETSVRANRPSAKKRRSAHQRRI